MENKSRVFFILTFLGIFLTLWLAPTRQAKVALAAVVPDAVIDDFEDNDTSDWGFFGGNSAGGGGGPASDRPYEGGFYFSTGWGGEGTASGYYGGAYKNFDNAAQVTLPADPWFNVWVLNQSNATVDAYTLEITIREDTNGDGWVDGTEDSFRLDTSFTSSDFNDEWTLISAPVSSFQNVAAGGDDIFNGNLDEIVIVVAGVQGAVGTNVEVDFDQFSFTSGDPSVVVFDDMEHGDPFGNGWFAFNGNGGGGLDPNGADLPPVNGGAFSLQTGWGGSAGFYGGFGRTNPVDLTGTDTFNFWINPDAGQDYTLEINLQDDDTGDNVAANTDNDDEFQYNCVVSATGPCAISGGGWQLVSIPLADFYDDNSFFNGGNGVLDAVSTVNGGNGQLINVVIAVIGTGSNVDFRTDYWTFDLQPVNAAEVIDDFENGLPFGSDGAAPVGFYTFQGSGSGIGISTASTPPAPELPAVGTPNNVLQMNIDSTSFAGFIHAFENATADTWVSKDWSTREGISFWFHGSNSGASMFLDILDNRNADSTVDDAERWTVTFVDDFTGWKLFEFPFAEFTRKEIGNGAPNDGLTLFNMWGYAIGALGTNGAQEFYVDQVTVYGVAEPPALAAQFSVNNTFVEEGTIGQVGVKLNRPMGPDDPAEVSIDYATERSYATAGKEYTPTSGTLTFVNGGATELFFPIETFDDDKFEGDEQIVIRLTNPVDVERGALFQGSVLIDDNDPFDPELLDDFEQGAYLWESNSLLLTTTEIAADNPLAIPGQGAYETILNVTPSLVNPAALHTQVITDLSALLPTGNRKDDGRIQKAILRIQQGQNPRYWLSDYYLVENQGKRVFDRDKQAIQELMKLLDNGNVPAAPIQAAIDQLLTADQTLVELALDLAIANGGKADKISEAQKELANALSEIASGDYDEAAANFREAWQNASKAIKRVSLAPATFNHDFALGQDWTGTESLDFWYYGAGNGQDVTVTLKNNRAPDPGPSGWGLVWSDEFDEAAGSPPNPANWSYEIGDTTPDGKNGWGNEELQYYTDDPANAATDGNGNLVITLDEADPELECYYGPCAYESARLISLNKAEFAYGRIESRLLVPDGGDGLWPAFWSLGTDITYNPWPGAGEIDFMEYVSRLPNEIFGTVHGPGYNGGGSIGDLYDFGEPVYNDYHTFTVEWEPNLITWYVDGIQYHQVTPSDVPGPWVFEKPFFLLLNFAIGGNFGGSVDPNNVYPQEYLVDYIRVYQGPDTAERFEATFTDAAPGWQEISIPMTEFTRSTDQPAGAPNDSLNLDEVWGYGLALPDGGTGGEVKVDLVRRTPFPPPTELVVTNLDDSGPGSLREALAIIAEDGSITFDPTLAGGTIVLSSGQLVAGKSVTIDGAGVTVSGNNASRVLEVATGATVSISNMTITDGVGAPQGGGILNFGTLNLDAVTVTNNTETSTGTSFELGGGGIYNGDGATLNLTNSTVSNNSTVAQPGGGIYGFFNSTINLTNSTVSGNVAGDVAGGLRTLGNATIVDSTISGNTSSAWHGGGMFSTDGTVTIVNSAIVNNNAPDGTAGGLMVATFGAPVSVSLQDSTVANNSSYSCQVEGDPAVAVLTSLGGNTFTDNSCNPIASDIVDPDFVP